MGELLWAKFFPPKEEERSWYWYLREHILEIPKVLKTKWQRSTRGWADCDVWSIDIWFCHVVPDMLRQLAKNKQGCPMEMFSEEELTKMEAGDSEDIDDEAAHRKWYNILTHIANDLEAYDRYWDELDLDDFPTSKCLSGEDFTDEDRAVLNRLHAGEKAAYAKVKVGLMEFYERFYSLWDQEERQVST